MLTDVSRGWKPLPGGAILAWHCTCGEDCPSDYMTAEQLVAEVQGLDIRCSCDDCDNPVEVVSYDTDAGDIFLQVDVENGVVYVPYVFPVGAPLEVL